MKAVLVPPRIPQLISPTCWVYTERDHLPLGGQFEALLGEGAFDDLWLAPGRMAFGVLGQQRGCDELAGQHVGVEVHEGLVLHALGDELESSSRLLMR